MAFSLMGPAHWFHGSTSRKKRDALEARLAGGNATVLDAPLV
jgi:hypothetical protein